MVEGVQADMTYYTLVFIWMLSGNFKIIAYFGEKEHCQIAREVYARGLAPDGELQIFCVPKKNMD